MSWATWWVFVAMTFVVSATPGPNMLLVMGHGARHGLRASTFTMAGCMTALLAMMGLSAAGLGALLHTWPAVLDALRMAGAVYLAHLGLALWRTAMPVQPQPLQDAEAAEPEATQQAKARQATHWDLYRQGAAVAASNPKAIVFAAAFLPQFIAPDVPVLPQMLMLLVSFTVIEVGWYAVYAACGHTLARHLKRAPVMRAFNRASGAVFVVFALLMAFGR